MLRHPAARFHTHRSSIAIRNSHAASDERWGSLATRLRVRPLSTTIQAFSTVGLASQKHERSDQTGHFSIPLRANRNGRLHRYIQALLLCNRLPSIHATVCNSYTMVAGIYRRKPPRTRGHSPRERAWFSNDKSIATMVYLLYILPHWSNLVMYRLPHEKKIKGLPQI